MNLSIQQERYRERRRQFVRLIARTLLAHLIQDHQQRRKRQQQREVIHPGGYLAALQHIDHLLQGSPRQFKELFRLTKPQFWQLLEWFEQNTELADTKWQTSTQKLLIFLWIFAFGETQRNASHCFLCAQSSGSTTFRTVLVAIQKLYPAFVKQPGPRYLSPDVELIRTKRFQGFSGCIGAIDGTSIRAHIPLQDQEPWWCRKSFVAQNFFAAVRFNTAFLYVLAGAEGSIHDNRLLREAPDRSFCLPTARFYLGDAGFGGQGGLLMPWSDVRYWQGDWKAGRVAPESPKELYNLRHARARNVIERTFGVLKRRWKILRSSPPEYGLQTQIRFIYAACGLHNFLLLGGIEPSESGEECLTDEEKAVLEEARQRANQQIEKQEIRDLREEITADLWAAHNDRALRSESPASCSRMGLQ